MEKVNSSVPYILRVTRSGFKIPIFWYSDFNDGPVPLRLPEFETEWKVEIRLGVEANREKNGIRGPYPVFIRVSRSTNVPRGSWSVDSSGNSRTSQKRGDHST